MAYQSTNYFESVADIKNEIEMLNAQYASYKDFSNNLNSIKEELMPNWYQYLEESREDFEQAYQSDESDLRKKLISGYDEISQGLDLISKKFDALVEGSEDRMTIIYNGIATLNSHINDSEDSFPQQISY